MTPDSREKALLPANSTTICSIRQPAPIAGAKENESSEDLDSLGNTDKMG